MSLTKVYTVGDSLSRQRGVITEHNVDGETKFSWLVDGYKLPKRGLVATERTIITNRHLGRGETFYLTREAAEDEAWRANNAYRLTEFLGRCSRTMDVGVLRQVAKLIGYVEE